METIKLYPAFEKAFFIGRENRFVMRLQKTDGQVINAYIANPGRMEEFRVQGHPFFLTPGNDGKYFYRVVSTDYQDSYVLLDTIKTNYLVEVMLKRNLIDIFRDAASIRREVTVKRSRFDFLVEQEGKKPALLEVKSCSLCHRGVAMFPDAPTNRGRRHLEDLEILARDGYYRCYTLYLINHKHARVFMPNRHTDMAYAEQFNRSENIRFLAYSIEMTDPVTLKLPAAGLKEIPIDFKTSRLNTLDKGSYLLVLFNANPFKKKIGALGEREFKKGYYVYVGSAMRGLEKRINRHLRKNKKTRWHLDYISPTCMKVEKIYPVRRPDRIEEAMARGLRGICRELVPGFGASDSGEPSHLFYFDTPPTGQRPFIDLLLDFRAAAGMDIRTP